MNREWKKQTQAVEEILKRGAVDYLGKHPETENVFTKTEAEVLRVVCMDEGTAHQNGGEKVANFGMAGSGILFPAKNWEDRVDIVSDLFLKIGANEVTSHDGCGACGIAFNAFTPDFLQKNNIATPDDLGKLWSRSVAAAMNSKRPGSAMYNHIHGNDMAHPMEFHNARAIWFNLTKDFDPSAYSEMPLKGFLHEPGIFKTAMDEKDAMEYSLYELILAVKIAFGHHGFGEKKFNEDEPLLVIPVVKDDHELALAQRAIKSKLKNRPEIQAWLDSILVDGLIQK